MPSSGTISTSKGTDLDLLAAPFGGTLQAMDHVTRTDRRDRFPTLAWAVLIFTILVIISGDIVQATESGAGCGETWPRCDGSLIPTISDMQTGIEFTHRLVTLVLGLGYVALAIGAWRRRYSGVAAPSETGGWWARLATSYRHGNPLWSVTVWALVFFVVEVILGALLVIFGWVESDASLGRVIADAVHLVNTFLMVGTLTLIVFHARGGRRLRVDSSRLTDRLVFGGLAIIVLIGISGAINSLADALYFADDVDVESTPIASILLAIRGIHPVVAIVGGLGLIMVARAAATGAPASARPLVAVVQALVFVQFIVGFLNIALLTPLESQIAHLVLAHSVWAVYVYLSARLLEERAAVAHPGPVAA